MVAERRIYSTLPPASTVGPWRVRGLLGRGAAATVYDAEHLSDGRRAAVKVVDIDMRRRDDLRRRFDREVRVMASMETPHVPRVLGFGEMPDGAPFVAMERLHGETLEQRLDRGPIPIEDVFRIGRELLLGVAAVHRHDVLHRDVKPANIFLHRTDDGVENLKLLDFGVCRPDDDESSGERLTREDVVVGTASYSAPELLRGEEPDPRMDLYAVGTVLYECLTGVTPFPGETWSQVAVAVLEADPVPPSNLRPDCPPSLERFVLLALARDPGQRFRSAMEMLAVLDDVHAGRMPVRATDTISVMPPERPASWSEAVAWSVLVLVAFGAAALATAAALLGPVLFG